MSTLRKSEKSIPEHLGDFLDWLDIEKGLSNRTQENYSRFLKRFMGWLEDNQLSSLKPHELDPDHVWKYRVFLSRQAKNHQNEPLKKSTQNYYLIALRSLLNYFANRDIDALPAEKIKLARDKKEKTVKFLNQEQLEKLFSIPNIKTQNGLRDRAILEILFSTGLRIAELVALDQEQVRSINNAEDLEISVIGKGEHVRTVYFSERATYWLKKYLKKRTDDDKALFVNYQRPKTALRRLTSRSIERLIRRYATLVGLPPNTTPHTLRHSFATDLLSKGVDLRLIQEFLGHRNIATTQIYTHVTNKKLRDIHRKFHGNN